MLCGGAGAGAQSATVMAHLVPPLRGWGLLRDAMGVYFHLLRIGGRGHGERGPVFFIGP